MNSSPSFTRREVIKTLGAGVALAGLGMMTTNKSIAGPALTKKPLQPFVLPPLDYAFDALEPYVDAQTMEIHHGKHHQGYVNKANKALADYPELHGLLATQLLERLNEIPTSIRIAVRNNVGGHVNHSLFWKIIGPNQGGAPVGKLADAIKSTFGSASGFQQEFATAANTCFGSGWAWLSVKGGRLLVHSTANQDSPFSEGATPLLGLDVWEHAYYLNYQNRRADYINAFWSIVNWEQAEVNFTAAS